MALLYNHNSWIRVLLVAIACISFIFASGCQAFTPVANTEPTSADVTATATVRPSRTPVSQVTLTPTPTETPSEDASVALTFWTVEPISSMAAEGEAGQFFQTSLRNFERNNTDIEVNVLLKKASGKGGVVDFLRTAGEVAPSIMPDVAVMNATDLNQAYTEGLIQRLDGRLDRSIVKDLLPAARRMGTVNEALAGVPFGIEMEHTIYNTRIFTDTTILWTDVLSKSAGYLFPAKGLNGLVNDVTLSHYFSAGGELLDDEGAPKIDDQALLDVLTFYQQAREQGVIDESVLEASTTAELWPIYLEAQADIAQVSVRQYLTDRELLNNSMFGPLPVQDVTKTSVTITHGWVLVLVAEDVNRQDAALRLIESFLSTTQNATWNRINKSIPTRGAAYQQLAGDDPYWIFLIEQLNTARPEPRFADYDRVGRIIQQAIEQVISNEATPEEATVTAIDALAQ